MGKPPQSVKTRRFPGCLPGASTEDGTAWSSSESGFAVEGAYEKRCLVSCFPALAPTWEPSSSNFGFAVLQRLLGHLGRA